MLVNEKMEKIMGAKTNTATLSAVLAFALCCFPSAQAAGVCEALAPMFAEKPLLAHKCNMRNVWLVIPMQSGERINSRAATGMIYP